MWGAAPLCAPAVGRHDASPAPPVRPPTVHNDLDGRIGRETPAKVLGQLGLIGADNDDVAPGVRVRSHAAGPQAGPKPTVV